MTLTAADANDASAPAGSARPLPIGWRAWALSLAAGLVLGVLNASQHYLDHAINDEAFTWGHALARSVPWWTLWGLFTPLVARVVARHDFVGEARARGLAVHAAAAVGFTLVHVLLYGTFVAVFVDQVPGLAEVARTVGRYLSKSSLDLFTYAGVAGGLYALALYRRLRARELAAARLQARASALEAQLSRAQLDALRMQLHPHFLFNTLNAISVLVQKGDGADAAQMIARLSGLLRRTVDHAGRHEVPLAEELSLLEHYLAIQQVRFRDRLRVEYDVEPPARGALVPHLVLQPVVENAIDHGIAADPAAGRLRIAARREGGRLVVRVRDDGPGLRAGEAASARTGVGLANTRARLRQLYGADHRLVVVNAPGGGAETVLELPFREATPEGAEEQAGERVAAPALVEGPAR
jgi:LytS/YehU family sensor histidine kinase